MLTLYILVLIQSNSTNTEAHSPKCKHYNTIFTKVKVQLRSSLFCGVTQRNISDEPLKLPFLHSIPEKFVALKCVGSASCNQQLLTTPKSFSERCLLMQKKMLRRVRVTIVAVQKK